MTYDLQNRWKAEGKGLIYYGMRSGADLFHNRFSLTKKQRALIATLPRALSEDEKKTLGHLLGVAVVEESKKRTTPRALCEARFCKTCCANDFIIPGLEFDENGICPMCATAGETANLKSVVPIVREIPRAKRGRFDVALFYTGGKDSTFLLYQLAKVRRLRVLALTWEIPFMSDCARASIAGAKKTFSNVEFITRAMSADDLGRVYRSLYAHSENTCACPSLAYLLFYPELVSARVPYFLAGNEPVQMLGLYYNHIAPEFAYSFANSKIFSVLLNIARLLTLHPPLRQGQIQTLMTMKQLAYGDLPLKKNSGYANELVGNVVNAIREVPELLPPLRRSIRYSSRTGHIPSFVHLDFNELCGGTYDWNRVRQILTEECGWVAPPEGQKALHTSCRIERCKDYSQFQRFYHCRSTMIPFSAIEISLASRQCGRSREEWLYEMEHLLGFSLEAPPEALTMCECAGVCR